MLLGGAVSLLPIFADTVLHAGPHGLGLLRAMPSLGALSVSMTLLTRPMKRNAGKKMLVCVAIFGAATVVFGLSRNIMAELRGAAGGGRVGHDQRGRAVEHFAAGDAA